MVYLRCSRTGWRLSLSREPTVLPGSVHMMLLCYTLTMTLLNPPPIFENSGCPLNHAVFGSKVSEATKVLALARRVEHLQGRPLEVAAVAVRFGRQRGESWIVGKQEVMRAADRQAIVSIDDKSRGC